MLSMLQFTLDLFTPQPPARETPLVASSPPFGEGLAPAVFRHPRANREAR